jgi:dethiobiotin synthetase
MIFVTGTDTGVGKTVLTGLLLHYLRHHGCHALAVKPFCSGGTADTALLQAVQDDELTSYEISPFRFAEPVAPLVAARRHRRKIHLSEVLTHVRGQAERCECLLVEGVGGVLVPLGEDFTVRDLIVRLSCEVLVVSANRLGTINHTLLTAAALQAVGVKAFKTVLMGVQTPDLSASWNRRILAELLLPNSLFAIGFLGRNPARLGAVDKNCKKNEKTLARILDLRRFRPLRSL